MLESPALASEEVKGWDRVKMSTLCIGGGALISLHVLLLRLSAGFQYGSPMTDRPIVALVAVQVAAGLLYLVLVKTLLGAWSSKGMVAWIVGVGATLRIVMLPSTPMLEDDFYRYLWDGAVVAGGFNPYAFSPDEVRGVAEPGTPVPDRLKGLASQSGTVVERVNHPHLRTVYPPLAQAGFALAQWLKPWSLVSWRLVLLGFDVVNLVLVLSILRFLKLPASLIAVYWWNPLLVKETFNSGHMDIMVLPYVLAGLFMAMRNRIAWAGGFLGLAVGVKIWPAVLLPVILRGGVRDPRKLVLALVLFFLLLALMVAPIWPHGFGSKSGFAAYGQQWEMNDSLFMLLLWPSEFLLKLAGRSPADGQLLARLLVVGVLLAVIAIASRKSAMTPLELSRKCLFVVAALFLLSPTQFPWYYLWMLPLLVFRPMVSLLLLTALLPLYNLRFLFSTRGLVDIFDYGIVWLEFVPVYALLAWELWKGKRDVTAGGLT